MKQRFWLFKRGDTFYFEDSVTGEQKSLGTKDRGEAKRLLEIKIQSAGNPSFRLLLLKTCLAPEDSRLVMRTWQAVIDQMVSHGKEPTRERSIRAFKGKSFDRVRKMKLIETTGDDFLSILNSCPPSANHYLRRLHNLALGLAWLAFPVVPSRLWPKPLFKDKRAITRAEHELILEAEKNPERNLFYQLLWEIGASQSDAARLTAEQIQQGSGVLSFDRMKTGSTAQLFIGKSLRRILDELPEKGLFFHSLAKSDAKSRAAEFYRRCKLLKIEGISLHSYRYAWAERAKTCGYPERFAQEALGHNSAAVHRAYARNAKVIVPTLEEYEKNAESKMLLVLPPGASQDLAGWCKVAGMKASGVSEERQAGTSAPRFESLAVSAARLAGVLENRIAGFLEASDENLGHLESALAEGARELLRQATERGAQQKADATPPRCRVCQHPLTRLSGEHARTFETRFGPITIRRTRGYCKRCHKWRVPGDSVLGLEETAGYSPPRAGDGRPAGQQDTGERSQRGARTADRSEVASRHPRP